MNFGQFKIENPLDNKKDLKESKKTSKIEDIKNNIEG